MGVTGSEVRESLFKTTKRNKRLAKREITYRENEKILKLIQSKMNWKSKTN